MVTTYNNATNGSKAPFSYNKRIIFCDGAVDNVNNKLSSGCIAYDGKGYILGKLLKCHNVTSPLLAEILTVEQHLIRHYNAAYENLTPSVTPKLSLIPSQKDNHIFLRKFMLNCKIFKGKKWN